MLSSYSVVLFWLYFCRCQKWVENCRRADLEDKTPDQLNKHYRLCAKHFETSMICRTSPYRTVLRDNAIPTIFDLTSHLNNPHSRHRKRIKELSEDEIRTLKQKKIDETSEQEPKHKEINNSNAQNPSAEEAGEEQDEDILSLTLEEKENKEYLKSLSKILILMGKQNIPLDSHEADEIQESLFILDNFQALLECWISSDEEVLRKRFETTAVNTLFCSKTTEIEARDL